MNKREIEMAVDMGETIICDQGVVYEARDGYRIRSPDGHIVGLGSEQYGLNGTNFRRQGEALDVAEQNAGIDNWSNENCPSDNT